MPPSLDQLLASYFAGTMTAEEKAALQTLLRADPDARRRFWIAANWEASLTAWGRQSTGRIAGLHDPVWTSLPAPHGKTAPPAAPRPAERPRLKWTWVAALAAAASVLFAFFLFPSKTPRTSGDSLAQLTFGDRAEWDTALAPPASGTMAAGAYSLRQGLVRFETTRGAAVTVSGPARFKLVAADRLELETGRLTARMNGAGSRLTVAVDGMEVTDLGTAFGIDATGRERTHVSVFYGRVAVAESGRKQSGMTVEAGTSIVEHRGPGLDVRTAAYDPDRFKDLWPLTVGINEASKLVEFVTPGPLLRPLRDYRANDRLFLFPEQQRTVTDRSLSVDLSPDAPHWPDSPVSPYPVPPGRRSSSYLVFFQPAAASPGVVRRLQGEIVFQHRVLGIICSDEGLARSDAPLGIAAADYRTPGERRGLEEAEKMNFRSADLPHDSVRIGPDGRTVHFDFHVAHEREQMRILVAID
jgi:hypothetical protein